MSIVKVSGNAGGTGTLTIAAPNTNSDFTLTLPTFAGTFGLNARTTQVFTSSGTYTRPAGLVYAQVYVKGGGASGAGSTTTGMGASGGEGEEAWGLFTAAAIGASQTVTIGAGGNLINANTNSAGNAGGTTSFGSVITAAGAPGGSSGTIGSAPNVGGTGGTGGDFRMAGASGTAGSGTGGNTPIYCCGGGKGGGIFTGAGVANSGGGGGGGSTGASSGAGAKGICVVYEFY